MFMSTVKEDLLKQMTEAQIQQIYDFIDKPGDPHTSGREMTESEGKRRLVLDDQYVYDGLRPKQQLPLKPGQAEMYLDLETNTYTYPERSLTDEELLQLIDWAYRVNYISSKRTVTAPPCRRNSARLKRRRWRLKVCASCLMPIFPSCKRQLF